MPSELFLVEFRFYIINAAKSIFLTKRNGIHSHFNAITYMSPLAQSTHITCANILSYMMVFFITCGPALYAQSFEIILDVADDATLYESSQGNIANSKGQYLFIGKTNNGELRRSLIRLDLGTEIPTDATIDSVLLLLSMNKTQNAAQDLRIYPVLGAWSEGSSDASANEGKGTSATNGDPTWIYRIFPDTLWDNEGGDFGEELLFEDSIQGSGTYTLKGTDNFITLFNQWRDGSMPNYGVMLIGNEDSQNRSSKRLASAQFSASANRPSLVVYGTYNNSTNSEEEAKLQKKAFSLAPNYPNPFNPSTNIGFSLAQAERVELTVYNQLGMLVQKLLQEYRSAGTHTIVFDAANLPSGLYFYKLKTSNGSLTRSMTLIK